MDQREFVNGYVEELNEATKTRDFAPFVMKWFDVSDCSFHIHNEEHGLERVKKFWTHLLPVGTGNGAPREVIQHLWKIEGDPPGGRVFAWRELRGGNAPKPLYGMQETQFDEQTLISEILIRSVQDKPEVDEDPSAPTSRLGRIFLQFAEAFNDFFISGDSGPLEEWCSPEVDMIVDSTFWGMGVIAPHNRINKEATFSLEGLEQLDENRVMADVGFVNWGALPEGRTPWEVEITPDWKIRRLKVGLQI
jgi:hypothetical protein